MRLLSAAGQRQPGRPGLDQAQLPTRALMESAGAAVARAVLEGGPRRVAVLCGPGNNGGGGFVAARFLRAALSDRDGEERVLCLASARDRLRGDALEAARAWDAGGGRTLLVAAAQGTAWQVLGVGGCVVGAVSGGGLSRPRAGDEARAIELVNEAGARGARVVAVDLPSGI